MHELIIKLTHTGLKAARARGRTGGRPRKMDASTLYMASAAIASPESVASNVAKKLNITTATFYTYINNDGTFEDAGQKQLNK